MGPLRTFEPSRNKPTEMDFLDSGNGHQESRIFQAFGVNPIIVGEIQGANRAQAAVAEASVLLQRHQPTADAAWASRSRSSWHPRSVKACWCGLTKPRPKTRS